ncbi:thiamine pyrophosphate-dependent enzyme [Staphylococcus aureus]
MAKGYDVPIFHVNADDVEAIIEAIDIAMEFRKEFIKTSLLI